ncbi:hypothetical protein Pla108_11050 [Botrimarina colliarenosi]|uniref:DUF4190 domain-containing protein n=2 Tax=Botrimarina colliarenosi TaxID=2528001 RepID=A0A5C6AKI4_9BACT|nr:hypothetical protein Pla108_11050 [Botrimarina colliarenosi]
MSEIDASLADEPLEYRSVHTFAVLGLLLGVLSAALLFMARVSFESTVLMAPIPVAGLIVSLIALRGINAAPDLYAGKPLAQAGAALSALFLVLGVGYASVVYATEVPDGYERTSFIAMKPTESDVVNRDFIPKEVQEYIKSGEPVFIKGYIRPDSIKFKQNLNNFLLVRDNQQCCFGDLSKVQYFDQIQVKLGTGLSTDYHSGLFRVGGVLKVAPGDPRAGTPLTYELVADYIKP